jgi:hypothetical protein
MPVRRKPVLTLQQTNDNFAYRDLNHNEQLDLYEDARLPIETRVADLLTRLTLTEKAGLMFQTFATDPATPSPTIQRSARGVANFPSGQNRLACPPPLTRISLNASLTSPARRLVEDKHIMDSLVTLTHRENCPLNCPALWPRC